MILQKDFKFLYDKTSLDDMQREEEMKPSDSYGIHTKYYRYLFHAQLQEYKKSDAEEPPVYRKASPELLKSQNTFMIPEKSGKQNLYAWLDMAEYHEFKEDLEPLREWVATLYRPTGEKKKRNYLNCIRRGVAAARVSPTSSTSTPRG